jgi:hypothetical protein
MQYASPNEYMLNLAFRLIQSKLGVCNGEIDRAQFEWLIVPKTFFATPTSQCRAKENGKARYEMFDQECASCVAFAVGERPSSGCGEKRVHNSLPTDRRSENWTIGRV